MVNSSNIDNGYWNFYPLPISPITYSGYWTLNRSHLPKIYQKSRMNNRYVIRPNANLNGILEDKISFNAIKKNNAFIIKSEMGLRTPRIYAKNNITEWIRLKGTNPFVPSQTLRPSQLRKVPPSIIEELRKEIQSGKKRKRNANNVGTPPKRKRSNNNFYSASNVAFNNRTS